jgi:hypothetical protein
VGRVSHGDGLARLREALEAHGCTVRGRAAQCPVPDHHDRQASLSIGQGRESAVLRCHAGCETDAVLEALSMSAADLYDEPRQQGNGASYQVTATYAYTDEHGRLLFAKERRAPKDFRIKRPDGRGGWAWGLGDARRVLYNLPAVLAAIEAGQTVHVAEGEKDCDAIGRAGGVATCNFEGAARDGQRPKWRPEYGDVLKGADVVVIADKDEPGRSHAAAVTADLAGKAKSITIAEAAEGKDAYDHLAAGLGLDDFVPAAGPAPDAAIRFQVDQEKARLRARQIAEAELLAEDSKPAPVPVRLDVLLAEPDEPVSYRIDRLWPAGGRVILAAQRKAGKTTCTGNLLRSLADGDAFLGRYAVTPVGGGTVFAIDTEMSRRMLRAWLADQKISHPDRVHIEPLRGAVSSFAILDPRRRAGWAQAIRQRAARVLLIDCIGPVLAAAGLDENSSLDVGRFLAALEELLADAGVAEAALCHHMGHAAERSRGASRLRDWPDAEWKLVYELADDDTDATPVARRYFSAAGRDVAEPEQLLDYDAASRHLTVAGGSRRDEKTGQLLAEILAYVGDHDEAECSKTRIEQAVEGRAADIRKVLTVAAGTGGNLCVHPGIRGARLHRIREKCAEHSRTPSHPVQEAFSLSSTPTSTPSHPYRGDVVVGGDLDGLAADGDVDGDRGKP